MINCVYRRWTTLKNKMKLIFLNEIDIDIFDQYFYEQILKNVVDLKKKKGVSVVKNKEQSFSSEV